MAPHPALHSREDRLCICCNRLIAKPALNILGQLGWTRADENTYQREGESLTLDVTPDGEDTLVRYSLLPR